VAPEGAEARIPVVGEVRRAGRNEPERSSTDPREASNERQASARLRAKTRRDPMRKILGLMTLAVLCAALGAVAEAPPAKVSLDACKVKQAAVAFDHAAHAKVGECKTCHHEQANLTAANAASTEVKKCAECHLKPEAATTLGCSDMGMTKNMFHVSCVNCHKETVKADATKKAPTKCAECHPKG
jgi:hypothetical protein